MSDTKPSSQELAKNWDVEVQRVKRAKRELSTAETALLNAANNFGRSMDPGNMKTGEVFNLWVRFAEGREELVACRKDGHGDYAVALRGSLLPAPVRHEA